MNACPLQGQNAYRRLLPCAERPEIGRPGSYRRGAAGKRTANVRFHFKVPHKHRRAKGAKYISPSTASIQVTVFNASHSTQLATATQNVAPGAGGCTAVSGGTFSCSFGVAVPPGADTFDVVAFDQANAAGSQLSSITDFPFTVVAGASNSINMTLEGIIAKIGVALVGTSIFATGNATNGFQFAGEGPGAVQELQLSAEDADGNVIVYPTSPPTLDLTTTDSAKVTIAAVNGSGLFKLTPLTETNALPSPDPSTAITLSAKGTPSTGSPVTTPVSLQLDPVAYSSTLTGSPDGIDTPDSVAVDASGNLYVGNGGGNLGLSVYPPSTSVTTPSFSLGVAASRPAFVSFDASGNLYVVNTVGKNINEYLAPITSSSTVATTFGSSATLSGPGASSVDATGNVYVINNNSGSINVLEYAPAAPTTVVRALANGSAYYSDPVDILGNVYVAAPNPAGPLNVFGPGTATATIDTFSLYYPNNVQLWP